MERQLYDRDRVGVQDFVLLENYQSEEAFIDNLRKRFQENIIYVSSSYVVEMFSILINSTAMIFYNVTDLHRSSVGIH